MSNIKNRLARAAGSTSKPTLRVGMDKNFRVAQTKYYDFVGGIRHILFDVYERSRSSDSEQYASRYNLWVSDPQKVAAGYSLNPGKWYVIGFYAQSFATRTEKKYETILTLKHIDHLTNKSEAHQVAAVIMEASHDLKQFFTHKP
jgi:hypothetical protein